MAPSSSSKPAHRSSSARSSSRPKPKSSSSSHHRQASTRPSASQSFHRSSSSSPSSEFRPVMGGPSTLSTPLNRNPFRPANFERLSYDQVVAAEKAARAAGIHVPKPASASRSGSGIILRGPEDHSASASASSSSRARAPKSQPIPIPSRRHREPVERPMRARGGGTYSMPGAAAARSKEHDSGHPKWTYYNPYSAQTDFIGVPESMTEEDMRPKTYSKKSSKLQRIPIPLKEGFVPPHILAHQGRKKEMARSLEKQTIPTRWFE
ncbi:unnamed protein product [Chondrus crispus]|uniref:Uncharacterized protein n=1 Tax=Chondrus crispus TaxID=2769 RepID=R7Q692_CHOCR|nr:unnamed protein product [Chondrus crispus]CDF32911.1 unnamed protein product [Chondrus crispus]|eukprot:XP_005712712.1 unnamed protein product [Chondrus crispus]